MKWLRPAINGGPSNSPSPRCAHTSSWMGGKLFIYGGWNGSRMLKDLYIFHPDTMEWSRPITTGTEPRCRAGHTCTGIGHKLLVWGGGDGENYLNDLHTLDTETMSWNQAYTTGSSPSARSRHTATLVNDKQLMIIAGGGDTCVFNDVYLLDTDSMAWSKPTVQGTPPVPRWGHTATLIDEDQVVLFGGHDGSRMLNDLIILDLNTMRWEYPKCTGDAPPPLAGHTATPMRICDKNCILYFGGGDGNDIYNDVYLLNLHTFQWAKPPIKGQAPSKRCAHTTNQLKEKLLMVFGGGDGSRRFKDIYLLDVHYVIENNNNGITKKKRMSRNGLISGPARGGKVVTAIMKNKANHPVARYGPVSPVTARNTPPPPPPVPLIRICNNNNGNNQDTNGTNNSSPTTPRNAQSPLATSRNIPQNGDFDDDECIPSHSTESLPPSECNGALINHTQESNLMNITTWLDSIGMGAFKDNFIKEDITLDLLPYLTEKHLEILKIPTLGARLRLINYIKQFTQPLPQQHHPQLPHAPQQTTQSPQQPTQSPQQLPQALTQPLQPSLMSFQQSQIDEVQRLRIELTHRSSELKRLENLVQHLVYAVSYTPPTGHYLQPTSTLPPWPWSPPTPLPERAPTNSVPPPPPSPPKTTMKSSMMLSSYGTNKQPESPNTEINVDSKGGMFSPSLLPTS